MAEMIPNQNTVNIIILMYYIGKTISVLIVIRR